MAFEYSSFISYRHNDIEDVYFINLRNFLQPSLFRATDITGIFYDKETIRWGEEWDDDIYDGIEQSLFFLPLWYDLYLSEKNIWCAKELYHALQVEKAIKEQLDPNDRDDFVFIFPLIFLGSTDLIPDCLSRKQAKSLVGFELNIKLKRLSNKFQEFITEVYNTLHKHFRILEKYPNINLHDELQKIEKPTDEKIKEWIREQRKNMKEKESKQLPVLRKNGE